MPHGWRVEWPATRLDCRRAYVLVVIERATRFVHIDRVCARHHITHKLTRPYHPQTNGMVERFNRRLADAISAQPQLPP